MRTIFVISFSTGVEYAIDVETRVRRSHLSTCVEGRRCVNPLKSRVILKIRVFRALEHQPCPQERAFPRVISSSRRRAKIALASRFMLSFTSLPPDFILEFIRLEVTIKSLSACFTSTARQVNKKVVTCELTRTRATAVQRA